MKALASLAWVPAPRDLPGPLRPVLLALWDLSGLTLGPIHATPADVAARSGVSLGRAVRGLNALVRLGAVRRVRVEEGRVAFELVGKDDLIARARRRKGGRR